MLIIISWLSDNSETRRKVKKSLSNIMYVKAEGLKMGVPDAPEESRNYFEKFYNPPPFSSSHNPS